MKPITGEWLEKAEGDFATVIRETRARKSPNYDAACFHAQQCAEKYLKACLCEAGIEPTKIHDLVALLDQVLAVEPGREVYREDLAYLSAFAVAFRYLGQSDGRESAIDARRRCQRFRRAARIALRPDAKQSSDRATKTPLAHTKPHRGY